jgi:hypothetical protein
MARFVLDCTEWPKYRNTKGYGIKYERGGRVLAHRAAYEDAYGPIGVGRQIHHLCQNHACIEPDHMISVTPGQHSTLFDARKPKVSYCVRGHDSSVYGRTAARKCRECQREDNAARDRRKQFQDHDL